MIFKIVHVILLASVKYILTIPYARLIGLNYLETMVAVLLGGIGGFLFFYYLSGWVKRLIGNTELRFYQIFPFLLKQRYLAYCERRNRNKSQRKIFTRKNRIITRFKKNYGFWGIIIATPVLLSIPLGAILANKYYSHRRFLIGYMIISIVLWAVFLNTLIHVFPKVI